MIKILKDSLFEFILVYTANTKVLALIYTV